MALTLDAADEDKINQFTAIARHRALIRPILGSYQSITTQAEGFQLWGGREVAALRGTHRHVGGLEATEYAGMNTASWPAWAGL